MKNLSIKAKLQIAAFLSIIMVSLLIAASSIYSVNELSSNTIKEFSDNAYKKKQDELKNYVSLAVKTVETYYDRTSSDRVKVEVKDELKKQTGFLMSIIEGEYNNYKDSVAPDVLKERIRQIIKSTRYGETGYFWVNDTTPTMIMHPTNSKLNGKNLSKIKEKTRSYFKTSTKKKNIAKRLCFSILYEQLLDINLSKFLVIYFLRFVSVF